MKVTVVSQSPTEVSADLLALPVPQQERKRWKLPPSVAAVDKALDGALGAALASGDFTGKRGDSHLVYGNDAVGARRVLLLGLGESERVDREALRRAAGEAVRAATARSARKVAFWLPATTGLGAAAQGQSVAEGAVLAAYRFDKHKGEASDPASRGEPPASCAVIVEDGRSRRAARDGVRVGTIVAESQNVARDLSNEPGGDLPPAALAREAGKVARQSGLRFKALGVPELRKRKMGGILAVGGGSSRPPRLIVLEHGRPGKGRSRPTICLVGKGVTFDSGGISIKPGAAMDEMKHDMSGAAAVVGALRAAGLLDLPLHVVGVIPAAENLPSATAYRPGDVVRTAAGKTIEVLNTDAEGRVILADALHYARTEFDPDAMVDLATLTGAAVIALGPWASGLLGNDEALVERVRAAGETAGERAWPLPLWEEHREHIRSEIADIKNVGGREGGTLTAGAFLSFFAEGTPWTHLDIAATAWTKKPTSYQPTGATGVGVRLLVEMLRGWRASR
jgi:leucyl aminopeptidase